MRFSSLANCNRSNYLAGCCQACVGMGRGAVRSRRAGRRMPSMACNSVRCKHVALRMAAADSVCQLRQAREQGDGQRVIAMAECHQRAAGGQADLSRRRLRVLHYDTLITHPQLKSNPNSIQVLLK